LGRSSPHLFGSFAVQPLARRLEAGRHRQHVGKRAVDAALQLQKVAVDGAQRERLALRGLVLVPQAVRAGRDAIQEPLLRVKTLEACARLSAGSLTSDESYLRMSTRLHRMHWS
jgi:hypothetical protein